MTRFKFICFVTLAVPLTLFEIWYALYGEINRLDLAIIFVVPMYMISFLAISYAPDVERSTLGDYVLSLVSLVAGIYLMTQMDRYSDWIAGLSHFTVIDQIAAATYLLLTLELLRRCVGPGISVVVWLVIGYCLLGHHLNGFFSHRELNSDYLLEILLVSPQDGGLFSAPVQVAAVYAFLFVTFGKFLEKSGGGDFFFNLSALLAGRRSGGSAKVAITSSGLFGMISGSPASDVMTTGSITIPMMKRAGYSSRVAGGIEAVASTGGALLPPVMGAVVFLMVEFTGIPYKEVLLSIIASSVLYYVCIYVQVHHYSCRHDVGRIDSDLIPTLRTVIRTGWIFVIPMGLLVYYMLNGHTPALAATFALIAVVVASWGLPGKRLGPRRLAEGCVQVCTAIAPLIAAVAGAGILLLGLNITGLVSKLSALIFNVAEVNMMLALAAAAVVTIICGMGMPVVAVYSLVAVMVAPALVDAGLMPLQAHLFLIFFAVASYLTPPVAVAAYVASTIADERPVTVAVTAARIGMVVFALPFAFVYNPGMLLIGDWQTVAFAIIKVALSVYVLAVTAEGWCNGVLKIGVRCLLLGAAILGFSSLALPGITAAGLAMAYLIGRKIRLPMRPSFPSDTKAKKVETW
ncbi:MAG: TRAP transporter fused permease subunit [Alcanivorax sp.]|nr:TRAP transporter fused permease subunit [Alcanivorax sp.]